MDAFGVIAARSKPTRGYRSRKVAGWLTGPRAIGRRDDDVFVLKKAKIKEIC